ncbi:hypothetical protein DNI29_17210 [Hymenobacter sediminis]|uniref:hypothetical protein n=1 Tax=Hymenobacter sediminis TaxID=2218621 RepID=UPI000DA6D7FB|nr:hypothetical protein [Hymenobacter sediminis]RPD45887.1 hypothetical protein DNI29_17210 [Hymenobacter sediminis]
MLGIDDLIGEVIAESIFGGLFRFVGRLLKSMFLFAVSPYLLLRGWLRVRPNSGGVRELYQQGKQAAAHDMQYVLSVVVALPLAALFAVVAWQGWKALLSWLQQG